MIVQGLDLSLTAVASIIYSGTGTKGKVLRARLLRTKPLDSKRPDAPRGLRPNGIFVGTDEERIEFIRRGVMKDWRKFQPIIVGLEEYSFGSKGRGLSIIHECGGVVKNSLHRKEVLVIKASPGTVKNHATGNGRASKEEMIAAAVAVGFNTDEENLADAFWVARWTVSQPFE